MRAFPMSSIVITGLSTAQLATSIFRWAWDSSHYVPLMWPYYLHLLRQIQLMPSRKPIKQTTSLSTSNISASRSMKLWRNQIPSTSSDMINIGCHISFRWATKSSFICRRNTLPEPIVNSNHSDMVLTPLPMLWVTIHLSSLFLYSLACTQCLMWTAFDHTSHHCWSHQTL